MAFRGGGLGTGNDFGGIVVRDIGPTPCRLGGSGQVTALDAEQREIRLPQPLQPTVIPAGVVLSADGPPWVGSQWPSLGVVYAFIGMMGGERDNPDTGRPCSASDEVTPTSWRVVLLGASWIVANHDPGNGPGDQPQVPSLYACLGHFYADAIVEEPS